MGVEESPKRYGIEDECEADPSLEEESCKEIAIEEDSGGADTSA